MTEIGHARLLHEAFNWIQDTAEVLDQAMAMVNARDPDELFARIKKLQEEARAQDLKIEELESKLFVP